MRRHTFIPQSSRCVHVLSNESVFKGKTELFNSYHTNIFVLKMLSAFYTPQKTVLVGGYTVFMLSTGLCIRLSITFFSLNIFEESLLEFQKNSIMIVH